MIIDERYIASDLNCDPREPLYWPVRLIRRLLEIRKHKGHNRFNYELIMLMCK